jgi:hypothetical protein
MVVQRIAIARTVGRRPRRSVVKTRTMMAKILMAVIWR